MSLPSPVLMEIVSISMFMFEIRTPKGQVVRGWYDDKLLLEQKLRHHLEQSPGSIVLYCGQVTEQGIKLWRIRISLLADRIILTTFRLLDHVAIGTIRIMTKFMSLILDRRSRK